MSKSYEVYESNMWQIYLFVSIFGIMAIFLNVFFSGVLAFEDGWIVMFVLNIPFIFVVIPCLISFYLNHARKRIVISSNILEMDTPLHSKRTISWSEFDKIRLYSRGPHNNWFHYAWGKDYTQFKISFIKESNSGQKKTIKFRIYNKSKASRVISLLYNAASANNKKVEVDRKHI